MVTPTVYVICNQNCKFEGMTKEQILTAIMQAVNEGTISNIDAGFVQTIKTVNGHALKFFVGEQSEYDALTEADKEDLFAIITNDTSKEGIMQTLADLEQDFKDIQGNFNALEKGIKNGSIVSGMARAIYNEWVDVSSSNSSAFSGIEAGLYVVVVDVNPSETTKHKYFTCVILCDADANDSIGSTAVDSSHTVRINYSSVTGRLFAQVLNTSGGGVTSDSYKIVKYKKIC